MDHADQCGASWVRQLVEGDERVVGEFWERYGPRLQRLADKHLASRLQRRLGPEDVVQSACRTFLRRAQRGEFQLSDVESLWRLMSAITLTKVRQKARYHSREKRAMDREVYPGSDRSSQAPWEQDFATSEPSPEEVAEFADQLEQLLSGMEVEEKRLVQLKLQNYTNPEIAEQLGCSERTVRRILSRVKARLTRALEESQFP
ncbi:MAG: sigma-70 family RNA polymerase sigma factor [Planctomycetales bacterium]|nr:sigma-70 family RNA polymerase sigma factor [Planctomycetales bacterium]